jgi:hypothetical protein
MPASTTVTGSGPQFFRITPKDAIVWDGRSYDATPTGIRVRDVRRPEIDIQKGPDLPIPQGTVHMEYLDAYFVNVVQQSILQSLAGLASQIALTPQIFGGGGLTSVADHIQREINSRIRQIRVSKTTHSTTTVYRELPEDGREPMIVRAVAQTHGEAVIREQGNRVVLSTDVHATNGVDVPMQHPRVEVTAEGATHMRVRDGELIRILPGGSSRVTITVRLQAEIDSVIPADRMQEWTQTIVDQLRGKLSGPNDEANPPAGNDQASWREWMAKLVEVVEGILEALVASLAQRIVASSVSATTLELVQYTGPVPPGVRELWALAPLEPAAPAEPSIPAAVQLAGSTLTVELAGQKAVLHLKDRLFLGVRLEPGELLKPAAAAAEGAPVTVEAELAGTPIL